MKLEIKENINIFYVYLALNLIGYDDDNGVPFHNIRKQVRNDFKNILSNQDILELKGIYNNNEIYPSYLINLAIRSNDGFATVVSDVELIAEDSFQYHLDFIDLLKEIIIKHKFNDYYTFKIQAQYSQIINELDSDTSKLPFTKIFNEYWGFTLNTNGIVYPNPLDAWGRAKGFNINGNIISVCGAGEIDPNTNELFFSQDNILTSFIHEASHFYAEKVRGNIPILDTKESISKCNKLFERLSEQIRANGNEDLLKFYEYWEKYYDETIVKVSSSSFLVPQIFKNTWGNQQIEKYREGRKMGDISQGVLLYEIVENAIYETIEKKLPIANAWQNAIDISIEKYL